MYIRAAYSRRTKYDPTEWQADKWQATNVLQTMQATNKQAPSSNVCQHALQKCFLNLMYFDNNCDNSTTGHNTLKIQIGVHN
jgi:hypothetical protein